jgi:hypothetical protein
MNGGVICNSTAFHPQPQILSSTNSGYAAPQDSLVWVALSCSSIFHKRKGPIVVEGYAAARRRLPITLEK